MLKNKNTSLLIIGFVLAGVGFFSLIISLVGVSLTYLSWLNNYGSGFAFAVKIAMTVFGFALLYIGATDWSKEEI